MDNDLRVKPDYSVSKIQSYLDEQQKNSLEKLRTALPSDLDEKSKAWCTDAILCRFLRARDWDHDKALQMIKNTLEWRKQYKPWSITAEDVKVETQNEGKMYRNGFDKYGRPILYMKPRYDNTGHDQREVKVKNLVYLLEKCDLAAKKNDREKLTMLVDFKDASQIYGFGNIKTSKEILAILQDHYPETLGVAYICNSPMTFSLFWNVISPFMHQVTQQKVRFVKKYDALLETIDADQLEVDYGGNLAFKYNADKHWNKEDTEFPIE